MKRVAACTLVALGLSVPTLLVAVPAIAWDATTNCSTCPTMTNVSFTWRNARDHQLHVNSSTTKYTNYTDHAAKVLASSAVRTIGFRVNAFDLENTYDYLKYGESVFSWTGSLTGTISSGTWYSYTPSTGESLQSKPMILYFDTDYSVTSTGFDLDQARYCCSGSNTNKSTMLVGVRNLGLLKGSGDVVFAKFPADSNLHHTVALWPDQTGTDFDLYVRCNAEPTDTTFTYRSNSSSSDEFIEIPGSASCNGDWYVAVASWSGSGTFSLVRSQHYNDQHKAAIRVGMDFSANSTEKATMRTALQRSARMYHAMTEGGGLVEEIRFYANSTSCSTGCGGVACDVCLQNTSGTGDCAASCGSGKIEMNRVCWQLTTEGAPLILAHEWGHCLLGLPDEYVNVSGTKYDTCGHSAMAFGRLNKNRWNLCYSGDHGTDMTTGIPQPGNPATDYPAWTLLYDYSKTPFGFGETPDNASYLDFSFNHTDGTVATKVGKVVDY